MAGIVNSTSGAEAADSPVKRPRVGDATEYGGTDFWVEYPSGLVDLSRVTHLDPLGQEPDKKSDLWDVSCDGERTIRVDPKSTALVVIDMQNFFLHPDCRDHPKGLACVEPLLSTLPAFRDKGGKVLWVNWGLTEHELKTIPPALVRSFMKSKLGGFGSQMAGDFGRLLMRGEKNADLYGPLQSEYMSGKSKGTDHWIHKNRISGLWGSQTGLDLFLQEHGIKTLFFAGVNADQCVMGTIVDAYFRGYDVVLVKDCVATTSPFGGLENVVYNIGNSYGFLTDSGRIVNSL